MAIAQVLKGLRFEDTEGETCGFVLFEVIPSNKKKFLSKVLNFLYGCLQYLKYSIYIKYLQSTFFIIKKLQGKNIFKIFDGPIENRGELAVDGEEQEGGQAYEG